MKLTKTAYAKTKIKQFQWMTLHIHYLPNTNNYRPFFSSSKRVTNMFLLPVLCFVVLEKVLKKVDAFLRSDLVDLDEVVGRRQLQVLSLLLHLVRDLTGGEFGSVKT